MQTQETGYAKAANLCDQIVAAEKGAPAKPAAVDVELEKLEKLVAARRTLAQAREQVAAYGVMARTRMVNLRAVVQAAEVEVMRLAGVQE